MRPTAGGGKHIDTTSEFGQREFLMTPSYWIHQREFFLLVTGLIPTWKATSDVRWRYERYSIRDNPERGGRVCVCGGGRGVAFTQYRSELDKRPSFPPTKDWPFLEAEWMITNHQSLLRGKNFRGPMATSTMGERFLNEGGWCGGIDTILHPVNYYNLYYRP